MSPGLPIEHSNRHAMIASQSKTPMSITFNSLMITSHKLNFLQSFASGFFSLDHNHTHHQLSRQQQHQLLTNNMQQAVTARGISVPAEKMTAFSRNILIACD